MSFVTGTLQCCDFDDDDDLDMDDVAFLAAAMNGPNQAPGDPSADLDGDGYCDLRDFAILASKFPGPRFPPWAPEVCVIAPEYPGRIDDVNITLEGSWDDSCVPNVSSVMVAGNTIYFHAVRDYSPEDSCQPGSTAWSLSEDVGALPAGTYTVKASLYDGPNLARGPTKWGEFEVGEFLYYGSGADVWADAPAPWNNLIDDWSAPFDGVTVKVGDQIVLTGGTNVNTGPVYTVLQISEDATKAQLDQDPGNSGGACNVTYEVYPPGWQRL